MREIDALLEAKAIAENRNRLVEKEDIVQREAANNKDNFAKNYREILENKEIKNRQHGSLMEAARNNALSKSLKAIYITALEADTLSDEGIIMAENMVDNYIQERGGASCILNNSTYLLSRLTQIVEDAAEEDTKDNEDAEKDADEKDESKDNKDEDSEKDDQKSDDKEEDSKESDDDKEEDDSEESDDTDKKEDDNPLNTTFDDDDSDSDSSDEDNDELVDDTEDELGDEVVDDDEVESDTVEVDINGNECDSDDNCPKDKVLDDLEKEDDVKKAVELIRKRVADAEESFIKTNAEDKKKIDELLAKISDNVKTVEDISNDDSADSKIAQEHAMIAKRQIKDITENRPQSIFERMVRNLTRDITLNESLRVKFSDGGELDMGSVIESAKVMYGWLETVSTLQLEKVDGEYIKNILDDMH